MSPCFQNLRSELFAPSGFFQTPPLTSAINCIHYFQNQHLPLLRHGVNWQISGKALQVPRLITHMVCLRVLWMDFSIQAVLQLSSMLFHTDCLRSFPHVMTTHFDESSFNRMALFWMISGTLSGAAGERVHGVLWRPSWASLPALDAFSGLQGLGPFSIASRELWLGPKNVSCCISTFITSLSLPSTRPGKSPSNCPPTWRRYWLVSDWTIEEGDLSVLLPLVSSQRHL